MGESAAACRTEQEFGGKTAFAFPAQIFVKSESKGVGDGDGTAFPVFGGLDFVQRAFSSALKHS